MAVRINLLNWESKTNEMMTIAQSMVWIEHCVTLWCNKTKVGGLFILIILVVWEGKVQLKGQRLELNYLVWILTFNYIVGYLGNLDKLLVTLTSNSLICQIGKKNLSLIITMRVKWNNVHNVHKPFRWVSGIQLTLEI